MGPGCSDFNLSWSIDGGYASDRIEFAGCSLAIRLLELLLDRDQLDEAPP